MRGQMLGSFGAGFAAGMLTLGLLMWHSGAWKAQASGASRDSVSQTATSVALPKAPAPTLPTLAMPLVGVDPTKLTDTFNDARTGHAHEALDIPAVRGTPVLAVADGRVEKLFTSKQGGLTVYQFDLAEQFCYYYAHLDGYAPGLNEGRPLRAGDALGYVGTTGNAPHNAPHLHFAVFRLGPEKKWWEGTAIDPLPLLR
jgi:murein DD-endopeptidase MepM/ murein hydrolase activator NlpD